ncbi:uncharacterized protein LJ264_001007 [Porphyrio hochstetteri]
MAARAAAAAPRRSAPSAGPTAPPLRSAPAPPRPPERRGPARPRPPARTRPQTPAPGPDPGTGLSPRTRPQPPNTGLDPRPDPGLDPRPDPGLSPQLQPRPRPQPPAQASTPSPTLASAPDPDPGPGPRPGPQPPAQASAPDPGPGLDPQPQPRPQGPGLNPWPDPGLGPRPNPGLRPRPRPQPLAQAPTPSPRLQARPPAQALTPGPTQTSTPGPGPDPQPQAKTSTPGPGPNPWPRPRLLAPGPRPWPPGPRPGLSRQPRPRPPAQPRPQLQPLFSYTSHCLHVQRWCSAEAAGSCRGTTCLLLLWRVTRWQQRFGVLQHPSGSGPPGPEDTPALRGPVRPHSEGIPVPPGPEGIPVCPHSEGIPVPPGPEGIPVRPHSEGIPPGPAPPAGGVRGAGPAAGGAAAPARGAPRRREEEEEEAAAATTMAGPRIGRAETLSARLLRLETRLARAERQLRAALALRGRLQVLEQRLENSGGEAAGLPASRGAAGGGREAARPRARRLPVRLQDVWVHFGEREWRALRGWQRALHRAVLRSEARTLPAPEQSRTHIKQEEELCATDQQQGEAGEAPEDSCQEQGLQEPEASSQARKAKELNPRELPSTEGESFPGEPDSAVSFLPPEQGFTPTAPMWCPGLSKRRSHAALSHRAQGRERQQIQAQLKGLVPPSAALKLLQGLVWVLVLGCSSLLDAHEESTRRDPPADCFESILCGSEVPGRPGEKFSKDPSPGVTWDSQWSSEPMETSPPGQGLGVDVQYEQLDFFSTQENSLGKRLCVSSKCERSSSQLENLQGARGGEAFPAPTCEKGLGERMFHLLPSQPGEKGLGAAPASCEGLQLEGGQTPVCRTLLGDPNSLVGEEQPLGDSQEPPAETPTTSPCWDHPQDKAEACTQCPQHLAPRGVPPNPQQNQARGKSYICSDCGKSFVCHSWLLRHQMTHTGERPYKCSQCDKSYRRKDYLLNHQRRHSGQGVFQCPLCRKRFVLRRSFLKHQESHVQETPLPLPAWPCAEIRGAVMHSI